MGTAAFATGGEEVRRVVSAPGQPGAAPSTPRTFGPAGAYDLDVASDDDGSVAFTFSVGHVAYLTRCSDGGCAPTVRVGTSAAKPESTVAVQPGTGRTTVMWRGRTASGRSRLQWRVTTGSELGAVHTLGELGDRPQLGTDASGKSVAVWLGSRKGDGPDQGVRGAARRVGEFTRPATLTDAPAADLQLSTSARGESVAAWLTAPDGIDPEDQVGTAQTATRTAATAFTAPRDAGTASALDLSISPAGEALLVLDVPAAGGLSTISTTRRPAGGRFPTPVDLGAAPSSLSTASPARGAIDDDEDAVVSWTTGDVPSTTRAAMTIAAGTAFGAPQVLGTSAGAASSAPSICDGLAQVAFVTPDAVAVARAPVG